MNTVQRIVLERPLKVSLKSVADVVLLFRTPTTTERDTNRTVERLRPLGTFPKGGHDDEQTASVAEG